MENVGFWKMNGSGNDFILIDNRTGIIAEKDMQGIVKKVCRRRESIGADGLIFIIDSDKFDFIASDNFFSVEPNKSRIIILKEVEFVYSSEPYPLVKKDDFIVKSLYDLIEFS